MITIRQKGDYSATAKYLAQLQNPSLDTILNAYGQQGVAALMSVTPVDTGLTARSWYYKIEHKKDSVKLTFCNSNIQKGVPIAIILQYGHGTGTGGWVEGRDYINPVIQPIFDEIANKAWREVTKR